MIGEYGVRQLVEAAFRAGYRAGFDNSREGWNGGYAAVHCADSDLDLPDDVDKAIEMQCDKAWAAFLETEQ